MISYKYPKIRNSMCFYIIKNFKDCFRGSKNMKEEIFMNKKSFRVVLLTYFAVAFFVIMAFGSEYLSECNKLGIPFSLSGAVSYLLTGFICLIAMTVLVVVFLLVLELSDRKSIKSALRLTANFASNKARMKVVNSVYPSLLYFLYDVLQSNNEFLKLPLGKDCSSLLKEGYNPLCIDNCIFYTFQIIMPKKSYDFDDDTLKQIIQSYIEAQLLNYGMVNLPSYYNSKSYGMIPSVYIEKVVYNEEQHLLKFAVMYISCEDDVRHYIKSKKRDEQLNITTDKVYDDEV